MLEQLWGKEFADNVKNMALGVFNGHPTIEQVLACAIALLLPKKQPETGAPPPDINQGHV